MVHSLIIIYEYAKRTRIPSRFKLAYIYLEEPRCPVFIQQASHFESLCFIMGEFPFEMNSPRP